MIARAEGRNQAEEGLHSAGLRVGSVSRLAESLSWRPTCSYVGGADLRLAQQGRLLRTIGAPVVTLKERVSTRRFQKPLWDVYDGRTLLGYVRQHTIGHSSSMFYKAVAIHPTTGEYVTLESSTDRDERVAKILHFRENPEAYRGIHWHPRAPRTTSAVGVDD